MEQFTGNWLYLAFWAIWLGIVMRKASQIVTILEEIRRMLIRGLK